MEPSSSPESELILELVDISKSFPGVKALDNVSIKLYSGEILCLLGENGAGKSTLMKILSGLYKADSGKIYANQQWFKGEKGDDLSEISFRDPRDAMRLGIGMVYQHFKLIDRLSVTENIILGKEITRNWGLSLDMQRAYERVEELGEAYGLPIDGKAIVEDLPIGLRQRTEILKQLYRDAELLIFDEPTAVLTPSEAKELFETMNDLRKAGKSIIFITHKLKEPLQIADRIVVIRNGKIVGESSPEDADVEKLASMVVGRKVLRQYTRKSIKPGDIVLDIHDLNIIPPNSETKVVNNVDLQVRKNEILGIAGVQGNGQSELVEAIMGLEKISSGSIVIYDKDGNPIELVDKSTQDIINIGVAYIPEDRSMRGLIEDFDITENSWLAFHSSKSYPIKIENMEERNKISKLFLLPVDIMRKLANTVVKDYKVQTPSIDTKMRSLSGGNQQKVILGREFSKHPNLIIASEPTRGVDIGVMEQVHQELINRRSEGAAVLVVSSDLDEILSLSDRIAVMFEGEIVGQGDADELSVDEISQLMTLGKQKTQITLEEQS